MLRILSGLQFNESSGKIILLNVGVAPITQVTQVRNKNSNIQGRSLNVIKVIFHTIRNCY